VRLSRTKLPLVYLAFGHCSEPDIHHGRREPLGIAQFAPCLLGFEPEAPRLDVVAGSGFEIPARM
jgi:hypothetical protein